MKKAILTVIISSLSLFSLAASSDFSYDKASVASEFNQIEAVSTYVESTNATFDEVAKNPLFEGNLELTRHIAVQPQFGFEDMDWISFAWGFLCCPVGFFVVAIDGDKSSEEKTSFWIGVIASVVLSAATSPFYYSY